MHFAIDGAHPLGSVHHQKIVVVDDAVAFCGGIDLTLDRWDTRAHEHVNRHRRTARRSYGPRHDVGAAVDGAAARALAEQALARWQTATKQALAPVEARHSAWPGKLEPTLRNVDIGIALTLPELDDRPEVREVEALNLAAIAAARDTIYVENQYLASRTIADALAARLREADGPRSSSCLRVKAITRSNGERWTAHATSCFTSYGADEHDRLGIYWPVTDRGAPIYIHSKVLVVDDRLLRIGSSNFNNRSLGFDSECDVAIEAPPASSDDDVRREIASVRNGLVAEHLGVSPGDLNRAIAEYRSVHKAVEALRGDGKTLRPFTERTVADEAGPLAENELMDPDHVPRSLSRSVQRFITGLRG